MVVCSLPSCRFLVGLEPPLTIDMMIYVSEQEFITTSN